MSCDDVWNCCSAVPILITPVANWRIEDGNEWLEMAGPDICHAPFVENQERESLWYTQHFAGRGMLTALLLFTLLSLSCLFNPIPYPLTSLPAISTFSISFKTFDRPSCTLHPSNPITSPSFSLTPNQITSISLESTIRKVPLPSACSAKKNEQD